jgi:hypothetical protein
MLWGVGEAMIKAGQCLNRLKRFQTVQTLFGSLEQLLKHCLPLSRTFLNISLTMPQR